MSTQSEPPVALDTRGGVIHDLGYRHHDGPRLGRGSIARALYAESARGAFGFGRGLRSKVMPLLLLAAICLPSVILVVVTTVTGADELPVEYTSYLLNVQPIIMVFVAGQAPVLVSRDLRFRVMSLYFSRPMQRSDYVLAKYAAMASALFLLTAMPLTILFAGALLAKLPLGEQLPDYLRALAGAALLALVLAGVGLVVAAVTPRRGLGVAAIIAVLAVLAGVQGTVHGIADAEQEATVAGYSGLISPFTLVHGIQHALLDAPAELEPPPGATGALVFVVVAALLVAGSLAALMLRYRKVSI